MNDSSISSRIGDRLTSRRGAWVALSVALLSLVVLFGLFGGAQAAARSGQAPIGAESTQVSETLSKFPNADQQSVLVVATRADGGVLSATDLGGIKQVATALPTTAAGPVTGPMLSEDHQAALLVVPIEVGADNSETATTIDSIRTSIATDLPSGLVLQVTGGPAFGADVASSFAGANFTLLLATILIVAVLLIVTYRSPILWLIPLLVVALADGLAGRVTAAASSLWDLEFDAGIVSVLVFGAGANYALLLISRYREELEQTTDDRQALSTAWRKTAPALLTSNVTVVLALLTLVFATIPMTRGLGIPAAIGLVIALIAVLFVLPPLLAIFGRKVFWPFVPRPGSARVQGRVWRSVATNVTKNPRQSLLAGLTLLAIMSAGLFGTSVGLTQLETFRVQSESASGLETLSAHFPPGEAQPIFVITDSAQASEVVAAASSVTGVVRATSVGENADGTLTKVMVTSEYSPGTEQSLDQISNLRQSVGPIPGADAMVGGAVATELDARAANEHDLLTIAPLVLAVSFVMLAWLLRSLVAPALLLLVNLASAVAAIGAGAWLSSVIFDQHALDLQVPILAFLFLVALGIDYTIFLVHRARTEAEVLGTRRGMVEAVTKTGSVITSAGIVLAGVFAALGLLPLVTLGQLGLIVGVGVIVDTLVVRTVIVPAMFSLVGDAVWLPGSLHPGQQESDQASQGEWSHEHRAQTADAN